MFFVCVGVFFFFVEMYKCGFFLIFCCIEVIIFCVQKYVVCFLDGVFGWFWDWMFFGDVICILFLEILFGVFDIYSCMFGDQVQEGYCWFVSGFG